jgi:hypothetical protein
MSDPSGRLSREEIEAEGATPLPTKEVFSPLLDLNVDLDLALDLAAPIDLAVAANANVAAPIDAAVAANVLSFDSTAASLANQETLIDQHISGAAIAYAPQQAALDQSNDVVDPGTGDEVVVGDGTDEALLDIDVNVALDADLAAPVAGAVAANANVAAPIDAAVAGNIGSLGSSATAVADQTAIINQDLDGVLAEATAEQTAEIEQ